MTEVVDQIKFHITGTEREETDFGAFLRVARLNAGKSQVDLAKLIGGTQYHISNLETGFEKNTTLTNLWRIFAALGYSVKIEITQTAEDGSGRRIRNVGRKRSGNRKAAHRPKNNEALIESYMWEFFINKGRCHICGKKFSSNDPPTLDHVVATAQKGPHTVNNSALAHKGCNSRKGIARTHLV